MQVVAEGVETEEQLELLRSLKCQYGQGFYFSKGLEVSEADLFILSNTQVDFKIEPEITFVSSEFLV
jgi:EAL domain-containing protein (putative c-di-GMP-specific phosphodiesterase class I)